MLSEKERKRFEHLGHEIGRLRTMNEHDRASTLTNATYFMFQSETLADQREADEIIAKAARSTIEKTHGREVFYLLSDKPKEYEAPVYMGTITPYETPYERLEGLYNFARKAQQEWPPKEFAQARELLREYEDREEDLQDIDDLIEYFCEYIEHTLTPPYAVVSCKPGKAISIVPDIDAAVDDILDGFLRTEPESNGDTYYRYNHGKLELCYTLNGHDEQVIWARKIKITQE